MNQELLSAAIKFNAITLGAVIGSFAALGLLIATNISVSKWGDYAGGYLNLLGVFLPGYSVSSYGAWIGAIWAFIFFGLAGFIAYRLYGKLLTKRLTDDLIVDQNTDPIFKPLVLRLYGTPLSIAVGAVSAGALFLSTLWLVIRGTAEQSYHADLLAYYLPGYSPSIVGALIGAVDVFILLFIGCQLLTVVYNKVVNFRHGETNK